MERTITKRADYVNPIGSAPTAVSYHDCEHRYYIYTLEFFYCSYLLFLVGGINYFYFFIFIFIYFYDGYVVSIIGFKTFKKKKKKLLALDC